MFPPHPPTRSSPLLVRTQVGRFFGLDCGDGVHSNEDFLSGLSNRICVTTNGKTSQTGGALFTDLPANMIGSFFMGLVSPVVTGHPLVWFRPDHPLQQHDAFHTALKVGFCGCLTTCKSKTPIYPPCMVHRIFRVVAKLNLTHRFF